MGKKENKVERFFDRLFPSIRGSIGVVVKREMRKSYILDEN